MWASVAITVNPSAAVGQRGPRHANGYAQGSTSCAILNVGGGGGCPRFSQHMSSGAPPYTYLLSFDAATTGSTNNHRERERLSILTAPEAHEWKL